MAICIHARIGYADIPRGLGLVMMPPTWLGD